MANEARVTAGLQIKLGHLNFRSADNSFNATVEEGSGPVPGMLNVPITGIDVDLSQLSTPGLCYIKNYDDTNYVMLGAYDGVSFFPLFEFMPGEGYPVRLSRHLGDEFIGTGTPGDVNTLRLMADGDTCKVFVGAFGK